MPLNNGPTTPFLVGVGSTTDVQPVSGSNPMPVALSAAASVLPTTPIFGQGTVGTAAVQLPSAVMTQGITISADKNNSGDIYLGSSNGVTTSNGGKLEAGQQRFLSTDNLNRWWVIGSASGQKYSWTGS